MKKFVIICPILMPFIEALDKDDDIALTVSLDGHTFVVFGNPDTHGSGPVQVSLSNHAEVAADEDTQAALVWEVTNEGGHDKLADFVEASLIATEQDLRLKFEAINLDKELVALNEGRYNTEGFTA